MKLTHTLAIVSLLAVAAFAETDQPPYTSEDPGTQGNFEQIYKRVDQFKLTDLRVRVGTFTSPSSTGNQSITGIGFRPREIEIATGIGAADSIMAGWGWATADTQVAILGFRTDDGGLVGGLSTNSSAVIRWCGVDGVVRGQASLVSMDDDGFTLSWSAAETQTLVYRARE